MVQFYWNLRNKGDSEHGWNPPPEMIGLILNCFMANLTVTGLKKTKEGNGELCGKSVDLM
jgi:hypothetical protein